MACRELPYEDGRQYDRGLAFVIDTTKQALSKGNDDNLTMIVGTKGSGKSMLMLHVMDKYLGEDADVKYLGLRKGDFANALQHAKNKPRPRLCGNDEANINKRNSLTKYNKDVMDLYFAIRGLNIWHLWCNPSLEMIDKHFIEEVMKGVIFIYSKGDKIRFYYYFTRSNLLKILEKYKKLDLKLLKKIAGEYAFFRGWFHDYEGPLLQAYLDKKEKRMEEKVDQFCDRWGSKEEEENLITRGELIRLLHIKRDTFYKYEKLMQAEGVLQPDDYIETATNRRLYHKRFFEVFNEYIRDYK